ncbi:hypothetical protein VPHD480_0253 [Vibrio phage D480]
MVKFFAYWLLMIAMLGLIGRVIMPTIDYPIIYSIKN